LGGTISDNIIEDSWHGATIAVEHNRLSTKTSRGRVYMSARVDRNVVRWSEDFIAAIARSQPKGLPTGMRIGSQPSLDPKELRIEAAGNRVEVPPNAPFAPILSVPAAEFNGRSLVDGWFRFDGDPSLEQRGSGARSERPRSTRPAR
jgi:hypothetical protein